MPYTEPLGILFLGGAVAILVHRLRWFTPGGALVGGFFGAHVVIGGGVAWVLPLLLVVVSGSLLAKGMGLPDAKGGLLQESAPRTATQVLANGGLAWGAFIATPYVGVAWTYPVFAGALAAATADTWGTEVGTRLQSTAWSLRDWTWVDAGTSGAVSGWGTAAGAMGALLIAALGWGAGPLSLGWAAWVAVGGMLGSLVDSGLGAFAQAQYASPHTARLADTPATKGEGPVRGTRFLTNSGVNAVATLVGGGWALVGVALF